MNRVTNHSNSYIRVSNLSFRYKKEKKKKAISNINLSVKKGSFIGVIGPSGAGKSTLLSCLNNIASKLLKGYMEGSIQIEGQDIKEKEMFETIKNIGTVLQDFEVQIFSTNVIMELAFGPENLNFTRKQIKENIERVIDLVNLRGLEDREPTTLSGGEKQRLVIGSIMTMDPQILCMDEPTTDLDPVSTEEIYRIVKHLTNKEQRTVFIIEHDIEQLIEADCIVVLKSGEVKSIGKPREILTDSDLIEEIGVMPLNLAKYFSSLGCKSELCPLNVEEAIDLFAKIPYHINIEKYQCILEKDNKREVNYGQSIIQVDNIRYSYNKDREILKGINLDIKVQEFIVIVGHNGSGKTTLAKIFNGLLLPDSGKVLIDGKSTQEMSIYEVGKLIGYVFQNPDHQIFSDTVYDEIAFGLRMRGYDEECIHKKIKEILEVVHLVGYEEKDPFCLTKGERQRVAVASVLVLEPRVLILDEPTTGLDYTEQKSMMELLKQLNEQGHTIVIITHSMWVVAEYAHRMIGMKDGNILLDDAVRNAFAQSDILKDLKINRPQIVEFTTHLGYTMCSYDELVYCTDINI